MAQNKQGSKAGGFLVLIVLGVAVWVGFKFFGGSGTSYSAVVSDFTPTNPADLAVTLHITNTGSSAGKPQCEVQARDVSYAYHGVDIGTLADSVAPGATATTVMHVTITKEGAAFVTGVTVKCS